MCRCSGRGETARQLVSSTSLTFGALVLPGLLQLFAHANRVISYLPTSAHLTYFLATAYVSTDSAAQDAYAAFAETGAKARLDPSCLRYAPTLVILHDPSEYLDEPANMRYIPLRRLLLSTLAKATRLAAPESPHTAQSLLTSCLRSQS